MTPCQFVYSGNRSGSSLNCMHANDLCGESGVFVNHVVTFLLRLSVDHESLRKYGQKRRPGFNHFLISDTEVRTANMECPCLPCRMVTKRSKHIDLTSLVVSKSLLSFFSNSIIKYGLIVFFDADRYFYNQPHLIILKTLTVKLYILTL